MAVSALSLFSNALPTELDSELSRQLNTKARTLSALPFKLVGSKNVSFDVSLAGQSAAAFTEGADLISSDYKYDAKQPATLSWAMYRNAFGLTSLTQEVAASSQAIPYELQNLVEEGMVDALAQIALKANTDLFSGDGTGNAMLGFAAANGAFKGGSYAGISSSTYPEWAGNVDGYAGPLTVARMRDMEKAIFTRSGERPDLIVTTPALFEEYTALFDSILRFRGDDKLDYGRSEDMVSFQGITVMRDSCAAAGTVLFLNTRACYVAVLPPKPGSIGAMVKPVIDTNGVERSTIGLPVRIERIAKTGDSDCWMLNTKLQLVVRRPNAMGLIYAVT